jgi:pimeloyl-ACP methyl ester carboxylesterase
MGETPFVPYCPDFQVVWRALLSCLRRSFPSSGRFISLTPSANRWWVKCWLRFLHFLFWKIAMRRAIAGESNDTALRAFYKPFSGLTGAWQLMRLVRWGRPEDLLGEIPARLAALPMPTLLFHGMRDVLPSSFAERAALLIPHSRVVTLDTGHFIPIERPKDVAAYLRGFFVENRTAMDPPIQTRKLRRRSAHALTAVAEPLGLEGYRSVAAVS